MTEPTETTTLLGTASDSGNAFGRPTALLSENVSSESVVEDEPEEDYAVDLLMTRFGSPSDNVGLGGGSAVFSSSLLSHRASLSLNSPASSRAPSLSGSIRQRPSSLSGLSNGTHRDSRRRPSSRASLPKRPRITEAHREPSRIEEENEIADENIGFKEDSGYTYGISVTRFWAVFVTILLVWSVAAFDGNTECPSNLHECTADENVRRDLDGIQSPCNH